jgi:integrase
MAWPELSTDRSTWTIPRSRMKNATAHVVPMCEAVRAILPPAIGPGLVFPGHRGTPFAGWSKAKGALDTASGVTGWRIHDLRRTVATGLQRLGVRLEVTESVLGHTSGSRAGVVGIYQRHDWADEKRAALTGWAALVASIVSGQVEPSNVTTLRHVA